MEALLYSLLTAAVVALVEAVVKELYGTLRQRGQRAAVA